MPFEDGERVRVKDIKMFRPEYRLAFGTVDHYSLPSNLYIVIMPNGNECAYREEELEHVQAG